MPKPTISSKTGKASITKVGHTAGSRFGTNPNAQVKGNTSTRDLGIK